MPLTDREAPSPAHGSVYVTMVAGVAAVGGLLFGYDTGVISGAILYVKKDFSLGPEAEGLTVSAVTAGALVGAFVAGGIADRIGRRPTNLSAGLLFVLSSLVSGLAPSIDVLVGARFVVGIAIGLTSVAAPMYIAEIAPTRMRGTLVSTFQLAVTIGILLAYLVCTALAAAESWRWMLGLAVVPGALLALGMLPLPDTPRWLVQNGRPDEAREALRLVWGRDDAEPVLAEIRADLAREGGGAWRDLLSGGVRRALVVGVGLAVFQQVTGINAVIYYAPQIFQSAGFSSDTVALAATMGIGVINVLATFIAIGLVDRVGRRPLLLAGVLGMVAALAFLALAFADHATRDPAPVATPGSLGAITAVCLAIYIVFFAFSLGPVVWLMISEIFPYRVRARAVAVSTAANWGANFLVSLTFPVLVQRFGTSATFWLYAGLGILTLIFVARNVPETKGRSLEEIERLWS